jgi:hypothetical protein
LEAEKEKDRQSIEMWRGRRNKTGSILGCVWGEGTSQAVYLDVVGEEEQYRHFTGMWRRKNKRGSLLGCGG